MKLMIMFSIFLSTIFFKVNNPMMMMLIMILQTVLLCLILWLTISSSWFSYILFLIFMGGLMVLFIYICSIASNEVFSTKTNFKEGLTYFFMSMTIMIVFKKSINNFINMKYTTFIMKMMMEMNSFLILLGMFYLLFTLIVVVKISNKKLGPIRSSKS